MSAGGFINVSVVVAHNDIKRLNAQAQRRASRAVRRAGFAIDRFSRPHTPVDTGDLRNRRELTISNGGLSAELRWLMPYAIYQHEGTRRGVKPKKFAVKGAERARPVFEADMAKVYGEGI